MRRTLPAMLLALFLGLGLTVSAVRAQGCEDCARSKHKADGDVEKNRPVTQWLQSRPASRWASNQPWYCWAHHNGLGCSSAQSELTFIFGSCRQFYGEPCFKGPPPAPGANIHP